MITIKFYGILKKKFFEKHKIKGNSLKDIFSFLYNNFGNKFKNEFIKHKYFVRVDEDAFLKENQLDINLDGKTIEFFPNLQLASGVKEPNKATYSLAGLAVFFASVALYDTAITLGVNAIFSYVLQYLQDPNELVDERQSSDYWGAVNNYKSGGAIPIVYGEVLAGSTTISMLLDYHIQPLYPSNDLDIEPI